MRQICPKAQDKDLLELLRVKADASDDEIKEALHCVFRHKSSGEMQENKTVLTIGEFAGEASGDALFRHSFLEVSRTPRISSFHSPHQN